MTAQQETRELMANLERAGIAPTFDQANTLRRASLTLHRWAEAECGDSNDYASYSIERDETTDKPYRCVYPHSSNDVRRTPIADREKAALARIAAICADLGAYYFHQGDPRGCALYVARVPLTDTNYSGRGVAVVA